MAIGDYFVLTGTPLPLRLARGLLAPHDHVLGRDIAGIVESVGANVTDLQPGDRVYGEIDFGGHAEYAAAPADKLTRMPANVGFEEAAAALSAVGTFAVQIAKAFGAEVTAVSSGPSIGLVRSIGADHVIDYTREDFTAGDVRYDLIFDLAGSQPIGRCRGVLTPSGVYVASTSRLSTLLRAALVSPVARGQVVVFSASESKPDLEVLRGLIEDGSVTPVIERRYQLSEVAEAFRQQAAGRVRGRKIISIAA